MAITAEHKPSLHQTSDALWSQLTGRIDFGFKVILSALDEAQEAEDISPYLAETIRDIIFQLAMENPGRIHQILLRSLGGPGIKFFLNELEDDGGNFRIRKSAELIGSACNVNPSEILVEYLEWSRAG